MKILMNPEMAPRRGGKVKVGNVYGNAHGKHFYRVVVAVVPRDKWDVPWKNVVCLRVGALGDITGCCMEPELYIVEHQDLLGHIKDMPDLKIEWLKKLKE